MVASIEALKKKVEQIEKSINLGKDIHIKVDGYSFKILPSGIQYIPSKTGEIFHASDAFVKNIMGPVGSGKSTINCADIVLEACSMPKCLDGVRRYRAAIIRNTYGELETTTLNTWMAWFENLGTVTLRMKAPIKYTADFNDENGKVILEIYFLALDREEDVKKLDSLEITRAFINEARHIQEGVLDKCQERIGRYPRREEIGNYAARVSLDTNPPSLKSWLYERFEKQKPDGYQLIKQPPGLLFEEGMYITNPAADNLKNLPDDYYLNAAKGKAEENIRVMLMGEYGISHEGKRVYHEYNDDLHSIENIDYLLGEPVYIGIDYETIPSASIAQVTQNGRVLLIKELMAHESGFKSFCENILIPYLNKNIPWLLPKDFIITDDPSGNKQSPTDEKSCRMILQSYGFMPNPAYSNYLIPRTEPVRNLLNKLIDGKSGMLISRKGCPTAREGFMGGYHYKTIHTANGKISTDKPEKNRFADIHDAIQYNIMGIMGSPKQNVAHSPKMRPRGAWI